MVRNLMMMFGLSLAVAAFGCSDDDSSGGTAGTGGGAGGSGGTPTEPLAPACDNADDIAAAEAGEPDLDDTQVCVTANLPPTPEAECTTNVTSCMLSGNDGEFTPTTLSEECMECSAEQACCIVNQCSILVGGACSVPPNNAACDACIAEKCWPLLEECGAGDPTDPT
jgi:hypothetical protein